MMGSGLQEIRQKINQATCDFDTEEINDGYQLRFVGKSYAKFISTLPTETVLVPNTQWNTQEENQNSENIFITGDNLDALKHLENAYTGKVDMIYIDPPYNTGNDDFVYRDSFNFSDDFFREKLGLNDKAISRLRALNGKCSHAAWLTFMLPRLLIAKRLLTDTGVIFISIDDNEQANLKLICDEVFGCNNFIGNLIWKTKTAAKGVPTTNMLVTNHDYILAYTPKSLFKFRGEDRDNQKFSNPDNDPRGPWKGDNMKSTVSTNYFTITDPYTGNQYTKNWAFSEKSIMQMIEQNKILWPKTVDGTPRQKKFQNEMTHDTTPIHSLIGEYQSESATNKLKVLFDNKKLFNFPKHVELIKFLIRQSTTPNSLILDFFAGSGTTAHAVMQLNKEDGGTRRYIMVQWDEAVKAGSEAENAGFHTIDQIAQERIKRAAEQIGDTSGFKHYQLAKIQDNLILDKIDTFNPHEPVLIPNDMLAPFSAQALGTPLHATGAETLLTTWLLDDGYSLTTPIIPLQLGNYTAFYPQGSQRLYCINHHWDSLATKCLLEKLGKNDLSLQSIVIYNPVFGFTALTELKNNLTSILDTKIEIIERF